MIPAPSNPFDAIKRIAPDGWVYWLGRELFAALGLGAIHPRQLGEDPQRYFQSVIGMAQRDIRAGGANPDDHIRYDAKGQAMLSREACYLVVMNLGALYTEATGLARGYFTGMTIFAEGVIQQGIQPAKPITAMDKLRQMFEVIGDHDERITRLEDTVGKLLPTPGMTTVKGWWNVNRNRPLTTAVASSIGMKASRLYRTQYGEEPPTTTDEKFGAVNIYPDAIIASAVAEVGL